MTRRFLPYITILLLLATMTLATGCSPAPADPRLAAADSLIVSRPDSALAILGAMRPDSLGKADLRYYNFLKVKAADKAYIVHTSDSLILDVLSRYSERHPLYPEILYYCGRVYSDLGDYPAALTYFHRSLDRMEHDTSTLKINALSQTGRLLNTIRLYDEAADYVNQALEIERQRADTLKIINDLHLLGGIYMRADDHQSAERYFLEAQSLSRKSGHTHLSAKSRMYLAATKFHQDSIPRALELIRGTADSVNRLVRNSALGYAARIYLKAGSPDSALIFAKKLVESETDDNKEVGYELMVSPEIRNLMSSDSLNLYLNGYADMLEEFWDGNMMELAIIQQANYNYRFQEEAKRIAENRNRKLFTLILILIILSIGLIALINYIKYRHNLTLLELNEALRKTDTLLTLLQNSPKDINSSKDMNPDSPLEKSEDDMRLKLRENLLKLYEESKKTATPSYIVESQTYYKLVTLIQENNGISEEDKLWTEIEDLVHIVSPSFKNNLQILVGGNLSTLELHTALLIKCGVTPGQMRIIFNREKGTISSRRNALCERVFDKQLGTKIIDGIIRLL